MQLDRSWDAAAFGTTRAPRGRRRARTEVNLVEKGLTVAGQLMVSTSVVAVVVLFAQFA